MKVLPGSVIISVPHATCNVHVSVKCRRMDRDKKWVYTRRVTSEKWVYNMVRKNNLDFWCRGFSKKIIFLDLIEYKNFVIHPSNKIVVKKFCF